jgi:sulfane dehydrogenase subunit SoxC
MPSKPTQKKDLKQSDEKQRTRRGFLKNGAAMIGLAAVGAVAPAKAQEHSMAAAEMPTDAAGAAAAAPPPKNIKELIAYGERSKYVTSIRMPVAERPSPDAFGLTFHVTTPLQDSVGSVTPSSLHYVATHRGFIVPEIDPQKHKLMIHGMVDRPLIFTMDELKRLPYVSRFYFIECAGNRAKASHKTVQETHGMTSSVEWTGVLLSTLLKEAGVQSGAKWIVAEGDEEVKGASSIALAKAMDDCLVAYGMNGEPVRPQQGFPLRLVVPGYEGIYNTKYLRRIKVVDEYQMTYNDYGHIRSDAKTTALGMQIGPKSVITFPSGGQQLPSAGFYEISGLAWSGAGVIRKVEISTDGGKSWKDAELKSAAHPMAHTRFAFNWKWDGKECVIMSRCTDEPGTVQPTREQVAKVFNLALENMNVPGNDNTVQPWRVTSDGTVQNALV